MALYTPDYKLIEANKVVDELDNELVNYYIFKKDEHIENLNRKLKEYHDFFSTLDKLLPNRGPIVYGGI